MGVSKSAKADLLLKLTHQRQFQFRKTFIKEMHLMKKFIAILLLAAMVFALIGCGEGGTPASSNDNSDVVSGEESTIQDSIADLSDSSSGLSVSSVDASSQSTSSETQSSASKNDSSMTNSSRQPESSAGAQERSSTESSSQSSVQNSSEPEYSIVGIWAREYVGDYMTSYTYYKLNRDGTYEKYIGTSIATANLLETGKYNYDTVNRVISFLNIVYTDFGYNLGTSHPSSWDGLSCEVYESMIYIAGGAYIRQ